MNLELAKHNCIFNIRPAPFQQLDDPRASEALDLIESKRRADGTWAPEHLYWKRPGAKRGTGMEVIGWTERGKPDKFLTLNALRVLKAAGRV